MELAGLSEKIFLDRYAIKDIDRRFQVGDKAIVLIKDDPKWSVKEVGVVEKVEGDTLTIRLTTGPDAGEVIVRSRTACDRPVEKSLSDAARRIAHGIAAVEEESVRGKWERKFETLISELKYVPAGRIWTGAGTGQDLTFFNCYVIPSPKDTRHGIFQTLDQMVEIMSRGGGVGINVSTLRPRNAVVRGVNGRSSGASSWMDIYSRATGLVQQGGCFGASVRIATDQGLIPAAELADRLEQGEAISALTHEGPRPLTAAFRNGFKPILRVRTARGFEVEVTPEHKMGVLRDGSLTTVPMEDLQVGDEILDLLGDGSEGEEVELRGLFYERSAMSTTLNEDVWFPERLTEELAYFLGYAYGDGDVTRARKVHWAADKGLTLSTADAHPDIRQYLVSLVEKLFGLRPHLQGGDGACMNIAIYSRLLVKWLRNNGFLKSYSEDVHVPEAVFRSPSIVQGAFFAGYLDADGCNRRGKGGYGIDSISLGMLQDLQQLLAANGILSHIATQDRSAQGWKTLYRLIVSGAEFRERLEAFAHLSFKTGGNPGLRNHRNNDPRTVWHALGVPGRYYQGLWDSTKDRISYRALSRVQERLVKAGDASLAMVVDRVLHVVPDRIVSVDFSGMGPVYDFEVADVHMLSGGGLYTSNSRRGALMLMMWDWHPDIFRFIDSKKSPGMVENANISVCVSDDFMAAIQQDGDWDLVFPDTTDPEYPEVWDGNLRKWQQMGKGITLYQTVKARDLWNRIIEAAWASAEPGVVFMDRYQKESNSHYYSFIQTTNPCGEQGLPDWAVCNLGHINLSRFFNKGEVDWDSLREAVHTAVRFQDDVIDATPYHFAENRNQQLSERRVGLGSMGLGELLIRLGMRYGSPESVVFCDRLYGFIAREAYLASVDLAKEKGAFPRLDAEKFLDSGFMRRMPADVRQAVREHGIRNVTILTQAPTGTVGTMVDTSTGIEPFYAMTYFRQSRLGTDEQYVRVAEEWLQEHPGQILPGYFVGAMDLAPEEHVRIQAAVQRWTDSSISKTCNAPNSYTVENTRRLYELAYELGAKGVTLYRDGSRYEQVLTTKEPEAKEPQAAEPAEVVAPRPDRMTGKSYVVKTHFGTMTLDIHEHPVGEPFEIFINVGPVGSDLLADAVGLGRTLSLLLRLNSPVTKIRRIEEAIDKLKNIGGAGSFGFGPNRITSLASAVAKGLELYLVDRGGKEEAALREVASGTEAHHSPRSRSESIDLCPSCGTHAVVKTEGCRTCQNCGFSAC